MPLKRAAATLAAAILIPGAAHATDYVTVPLDITLNAPADAAWKKIHGFCQIGAWLKTTCVVTSGTDGQVGAVRRVADRIDELLVADTAWSYSYSQPKSPIDYHGTVEIRPIDAGHSWLQYTLVYDADALPKHALEDKAADKESRTRQLTVLINAMKAAAEAQ